VDKLNYDPDASAVKLEKKRKKLLQVGSDASRNKAQATFCQLLLQRT
jgi:hypothetical protein